MLRREGLTFRLVQSIGTVGDIARVEERRRSPARRLRMSSTDMSAASGSCGASSETAYSNRFETGWLVSSETPEVASSSSSSCSNADSSVRRTSPNCRVIESMGSLMSSPAVRRISWPLFVTTNEPLVECRSRTEQLPCLSTERTACLFDMDLPGSMMSRRANPSSDSGRNGLRPTSTLSPS